MKFVGLLIACFCVATVLAQFIGVGMLWYQGRLTPAALQDVRVILLGGEQESAIADAEKDVPHVTLADVVEARARITAEFNARDAELRIFQTMTDEAAARLTAQQAEFEKRKKAFDLELKTLREKLDAEATEQARGVLLAGKPRDAVAYLMALDLDANIILLKGMPEKAIANILKEFRADDEQIARGQQIFEALTDAEPERTLLQQAQRDLDPQPAGVSAE